MAEFKFEDYGLTPPKRPNEVKATSTGDDYYDNLTPGQRQYFDKMPEDLQELYRTTPYLKVLDNDNLEPTEPNFEMYGGEKYYEAQGIRETAEADDNTYEALYPDAATVSPTTTVKAKAADFLQLIFPDMPETGAQKEYAKQTKERKEFLESAAEIYNDIGVEIDGQRVLEQWDVDENGNLVIADRTLIPAPDSTYWGRVLSNTRRQIQGQVGGLLTEGAITAESEYEKGIPTFEQAPGEDFVTDLFTFGLPATAALKGTKAIRAANRLVMPQRILDMTKVGAATTYLLNTTAVAFSDAVMGTAEDEGIFDEKAIQQYLGVDATTAKDLQMALESFAFSGALDGVAALASGIGGFAGRRVAGARAFVDRSYIKDKAQRGALLGVISVLDPEIAKAKPWQKKRKLAAMADMMSENAILRISAGDVEGLIPADTATAVLNGAKKYIANTRAEQRRSMSVEQFQQYVDQEAGIMALTMMEIARTRAAKPEMIQAQGNMMAAFDQFLDDVAVSKLPEGQSVDEALTAAVDDIVNFRNMGVDEAATGVVIATAAKEQGADQLANAFNEVPELRALVENTDVIFNSRSYYDAITKSMVGLGDEKSLLKEYKAAWDRVSAAYEAVPNVPVDLKLFSDKLDEALMASGPLDQSTGVVRQVLGDIEKLFKPKKIGVEEIADPLADPRAPAPTRDVMQTKDEIFAGLSEIGFQDMLKFKKELERRISNLPRESEARSALEQFSRHITDAENGQLAFVANSGNEEAAGAAQRAINTFIEAKSKFENSEPLQQFSKLAREVTGGGLSTNVPAGAQIRSMPNLQKYATTDMPELLVADKSQGWMRDYVYAMGAAGKNDPAIAPMRELAEARAQFDLVSAIRSGDTGRIDRINSVINDNLDQLNALGSTLPDDMARLRDELMSVEGGLSKNLSDADIELTRAKERLEKAQSSILESFVSKELPDMPVANPREALVMLMSDGVDGANKIRALMQRTNNMPPEQAQAVREAMKASAIKGLTNEIFGATPTALSGDVAAFNTKVGRLKNVLERDGNDFLGGLRVLFNDDPEALQGIEVALTGLMRTNIPQRIKVNQAGSDTAFNQQMMGEVSDSVSAGVLLIFGYMTPAGAMARNVTRGRIKEMEGLAKTVGDDTLALILSNPVAFGQMTRDVAKAESTGVKNAIVKNFVQTAAHGFGYQLRVDEAGEDSQSIDQQMLDLARRGQELYQEYVPSNR